MLEAKVRELVGSTVDGRDDVTEGRAGRIHAASSEVDQLAASTAPIAVALAEDQPGQRDTLSATSEARPRAHVYGSVAFQA
ncbi:MAG TPA: hypothetical protein VFI34_01410 [Candidatus Limnocylindrales bacterium]|nr:hypothetical protein [Candidatus Limnocylindrales bacterium]